jgi:2-methylaconitate cis-trans-isomerase PrpF
MSQTAIRCSVIRGGTSKGLYFRADDLPSDEDTRNAVLLAAMGSPDPRQIDGMGEGDARIDGVPGTHAALPIDFLDIAGSSCGALLPTGNPSDEIEGVRVTCVDNGMPVVCVAASDLGVSGAESPAELEADESLKAKVDAVRLAAGKLMNLGDVTRTTVPKMSLLSPARHGGVVSTRTA